MKAVVGRFDEETPDSREAVIVSKSASEADGSVLLDGLTRVNELEELAGLKPSIVSHKRVVTLGGVIAAVLGHVPQEGDEVSISGRSLRVDRFEGHRLATVLLPPGSP